jgi:UDP-N-acetylmuramate--alanine ligase
MIKVGILFGGVSREREISFAGGRTVYDNLNKAIFEPVPLFLDSVGNLILLDWEYIYKGTIRDFYPPSQYQNSQNKFQLYAEHLQLSTEIDWNAAIASVGKKVEWNELKSLIDIAFLALHGINGEDGSIQGILEMLQIPYTGSGILASAIGMNKAFQKEILSTTSYNKTAFYCIKRKDWSKENYAVFLNKTLQEIGQHYVVRPANQGSSIGVSILNGKDEVDFVNAVDLAFFNTSISLKDWQSKSESGKLEWIRDLIDIKGGIGLPLKMLEKTISHPDDLFDYINQYFKSNSQNLTLESVYEENEVVVESFIEGREFSCVVIENENGVPIALPPTEIVKTKEVYDYRSKYLPGLSRKVTPIDLPNAAIQHIRKECEGLYQLLRFNVYARIDGFYKPDGTVVLNDPNTTSGMLPSSFFFHQAAEIGLNPSQFISYIIDASLRARMAQGGNVSNYRNLLKRLTELLAQQNQHQNEKLKVGVILGGYSSERHISVESGRNIYEKLSSSIKYEPIPIFLSEDDGKMRLHQIPIHLMLKDNADDIKAKLEVHSTHAIIEEIRKSSASIIHTFGVKAYQFYPSEIKMEALAEYVDAVFIAIHGRPAKMERCKLNWINWAFLTMVRHRLRPAQLSINIRPKQY